MAYLDDRNDQLKRYIIDKAQKAFGADAVSRLLQQKDGLTLYLYPHENMHKLQIFAHLAKVFDRDVFDSENVLQAVDVEYEKVPHHNGPKDERMYQVHFIGSLTHMADNVEKNDEAGFREAQQSHLAELVLCREAANNIRR